jgi:uncharacterized protein
MTLLREQPDVRASEAVEQYTLPRAVLLHLLPGLVLTAFIVLTAPLADRLDLPPLVLLFVGIPLVLVPLEIGYLASYAKRRTGSWNPLGAVTYRERLPRRRYALWGGGLAAWFLFCFLLSGALLDAWLADNVFAWMPDALLQFASIEGDPLTTGQIAALVLLGLAFNGVAGPVTEELYFRGHLLPRLERLGAGAAPVNTVLFALYHAFSPWKYPAIVLGFLPMAWAARRTRSVYLTMTAHVVTNTVFLLFLTAAFLAESA